MFTLKRLSKAGVAQALQRGERYRLLNEPEQAESICLDVLEIEPENEQALIILLLSLTDQFAWGSGRAELQAEEVLKRLKVEYDQLYYAGIICERKAKASLDQHAPKAWSMSYELLTRAMKFYEQAEKIRPAGNDDALLRWNTCVRLIVQHKLEPEDEEKMDPVLE